MKREIKTTAQKSVLEPMPGMRHMHLDATKMAPSPAAKKGAFGTDMTHLRALQAIANQGNVQLRGYADISQGKPLVQLQRFAHDRGLSSPQRISSGGLPQQLQSGIESLSGIAMHDVRVHYNSSKPAQLQAHAYAQGTDIHIAPGQERHLPHEAWHVMQQKQGRVKPTLQLKGVAINDDSALEREADVMGARAILAPAAGTIPNVRNVMFRSQTAQPKLVQRVVTEEKRDTGGTYFVSSNMAQKLGSSTQFPTRELAEIADLHYADFQTALPKANPAWGRPIDQGKTTKLPQTVAGGACYGFAQIGLLHRHDSNEGLLAALIEETGCFLCKSKYPSEEVLDAQLAHKQHIKSMKEEQESRRFEASISAKLQRLNAMQDEAKLLYARAEKALKSQGSPAASTASGYQQLPTEDGDKLAQEYQALVNAIVALKAETTQERAQYDAYIQQYVARTTNYLGDQVGMDTLMDKEIAASALDTDPEILEFIAKRADGGIMIALHGGGTHEAGHAISISMHGDWVTVVDADTGMIRCSKAESLELLGQFKSIYEKEYTIARIKLLGEKHGKK